MSDRAVCVNCHRYIRKSRSMGWWYHEGNLSIYCSTEKGVSTKATPPEERAA